MGFVFNIRASATPCGQNACTENPTIFERPPQTISSVFRVFLVIVVLLFLSCLVRYAKLNVPKSAPKIPLVRARQKSWVYNSELSDLDNFITAEFRTQTAVKTDT